MKSKTKRLSIRLLSLFLSVLMIVSVMPFSGVIEAQAANKIATILWPVYDSKGNAYTKLSRGFSSEHDGIDINNGSKWYSAYGGKVYAIFTGCTCSARSGANKANHRKNCNPKRNGGKGNYISMVSYKTNSNGDIVTDKKGNWIKDGTNDICNDGYGNGVIIKCTIKGATYYFCYAHMNSVSGSLKANQEIPAGTYLGTVGNRGNSYGKHGHFAVKKGGEYKNPINNNQPSKDVNSQFEYCYKLQYKITNNGANSITNNSAKSSIKIHQHAYVEDWGYYISTKESAVKGVDPNTKHESKDGRTWKCIKNYRTNPNYTNTLNADNINSLKPNTKYYFRFDVRISGTWYASDVKSFTTKSTKPGDTTVKNLGKTDIGIGDTASIEWNAASNAVSYNVQIFNSANAQVGTTISNIKATSYAIPSNYFAYADTYSVKLTAVGNAGETVAKGKPTITVHPNVNVHFKDGDTVLYEESVKYGGNANIPPDPEKEGYIFKGWDAKAENVVKDTEINAIFENKNFTVKFIDGLTGKILKTEKVKYKEEATAPEVSAPNGYVFKGWDRDISSIVEDTTVTANYNWYDNEYPVATVIESATRNDTKSGYDVRIRVTSGDLDNKVEGRVIFAVMTESGYMLGQTESSAFSMNSNETKNFTAYVPCNALASTIKVFTINSYQKGGPISKPVQSPVNNSDANWSAYVEYTSDSEVPKAGDVIDGRTVKSVETKKDPNLYRYKTTSVQQSYSTSLSGYTKYKCEKIKDNSGSGTNHYVKSWPSTKDKTVIDTNHKLYKQYSPAPVKAVDNDTTLIEVGSESVETYLWWQWAVPNFTLNNLCNPSGDFKGENVEVVDSSGKKVKKAATEFKMFTKNSQYGGDNNGSNWNSTYQGYNIIARDQSTYSKWWSGAVLHNNKGGIPVYKSDYKKYNKRYTYYKINDWSEWKEDKGDTIPVAVSSSEAFVTDGAIYDVETRIGTKYYRYESETPFDASDIDVPENQTVNINQKVSADFAGKEATVYIYKYTQPSDYTNEYIGTTNVGEDGTIIINNAMLREAPSAETGDFTIAVSIKGTTSLIEIGKIAAPKPTYTVTYYDFDKTTVILRQTVTEGETVKAPSKAATHPEEGYRFSNWNQSTTNVHSDLEVYPEAEKETFTVAFVNWNAHTVDFKNYQYGDFIEQPEIEQNIEGKLISWDMSDATPTTNEGEYIVTKNTIINADIQDVQYETNFISVDAVDPVESNVDLDELPLPDVERLDESDIQSVSHNTYKTLVDVPYDVQDNEDYIFYGWRNIKTGEYLCDTEVTDNATYYPVYEFAQTTEAPIADVGTGEYTENQTVTLTSETPDAVIYYTTDGSDPKTSNTAIEYTAPIVLTRSTVLTAYSTALGMNNSYTITHLYAINTAYSGVAYHLVSVYSLLETNAFTSAYQGLVRDSRYFDDSEFDKEVEGYNYVGLFFDTECTQQFYADEELISGETTLYAKYTPKTFTVTFKDYDGTVLSTVQHTYGVSEIEAPTPTRNGYVFLGWDVEDFSSLSEDTVATARYCKEEEYATVTLNKTTARIIEGQQFTNLEATVLPETLSDVDLNWSSSDYSIATVDESGIVTAVGKGTATITVTVIDTGESANCVFTVLGDYNKSIVFGSNSFLGFDSEGYIRMARPDKNTVSELLYQFENEAENLSFVDSKGTALSNDDLVGTGTVVKFADDGEELDSATFVMVGDINGDGYIGNADVSMLSQWLVQTKDLTYEQQLAGDVNGDGFVDNKDAAVIQRYLVGKAEI